MLLLLAQAALFPRLFPNPTGANGLEEYVRAADVMASPAFAPYVRYALGPADAEGPPEVRVSVPRPAFDHGETAAQRRQRLKDDRAAAGAAQGHWDDYLAYCRDVTDRFGGTLDLIHAGNAKAVRPAGDLKALDVPFGSLPNVALAAAHLRFSQGRSKEGTDLLLEELVFCDNLERVGSGGFPSLAGRSAVLTAFARHLDALSLVDCGRVSETVVSLLARPSVFRGKAEVHLADWERNLHAEVDVVTGSVRVLEPYESALSPALVAHLRELTPAERQVAVNDAIARGEAAVEETEESLDGPEGGWIFPDRKVVDPTAHWDDLGLLAAARARYASFPNLAQIATGRIRFRMLDLDARIIAYRFRNGRLPKAHTEIGKNVIDPLSGKPFVYTVDRRGFEVSSLGGTAGPIYLDPHVKAPAR